MIDIRVLSIRSYDILIKPPPSIYQCNLMSEVCVPEAS